MTPCEEAVACTRNTQEVASGTFEYSVSRYDYTFDLTTRQASSRVLLNVFQPGGDCFSIPGPAGITNPTWNGSPARVSQANGMLGVCGTPQFAGQVNFESNYTVPEATYFYSQVGFSRRPDFVGNTFSYLLGWVESCDLFGPCDDLTNRLANYTFTVNHPAGQTVLCPGARTSGTTQTRCELLGTQAPTYSSFAVASNPRWVSTRLVDSTAAQLDFYEIPEGRLVDALDANAVGHFLQWITQQLGPLPYGRELRVASAPTEWLGIEHPANIILREDLPLLRQDYANMTMHTLMHEVVHQWAGNRTTLESPMDYPWKEALAEYFTYLYEEQNRNWEAPQTLAYWDKQARTASYYLRPQDNPAPDYVSFINDVYGTGPMILFLQLEPLIGRDKVIAGIRTFLSIQGTRSIDDLRFALEAASGANLERYFQTWLVGSGEPDWPFFAVTHAKANGQLTLTVMQQTLSNVVYPCAVEIELRGDLASQKQLVTVDFTLNPQSATVTKSISAPSWTVRQVLVDPGNKLVNRKATGLVREPKSAGWVL
ncbi:M1 family aminopeptidase [Vitiosangium sp. GDMCC 1.1324]|uniref:M1 family aminopeptidase n=1 Tax=Vitiosangium sp. (strain GDMCC 1.1324) TaxID=2138576 RepID=UPI00130D8E76|nr:M1 family aminopeptidase [Vitiosangium sp. GDMCC 1.1324]